MELLAKNADAIEARLRALKWIGAKESIVELAPAGEGNMNRTLRANLGSRSIVLKQSVPFVAKYPDIPAPLERASVEAAFYAAASTSDVVSRRMPQLLGYDDENRLLCFEDLGAAQDFTSLYAAIEADDIHADLISLIDWLGALHALDIDGAFANNAMRELNHQHIFVVPLLADNGVAIEPELTPLYESFTHDEALGAHAQRLGAIYLGTASHDSRPVLLHGDFYPGSWLNHRTEGAMVIDPEFGFKGAPEFDVGVFTAHLTMCGYRQSAITTLLENYHAPDGFDSRLASGFAGMEVIRRIFGVAQLPLSADVETQAEWLNTARTSVVASGAYD